MPRFTPIQAAGALRRMASRLRSEAEQAERQTLAQGLGLARSLSRGPYRAAQLRRMGHPYRRGGRPPADPAQINRQSGVFLRSWRAEGPRNLAGTFSGRIVNSAPWAGFLDRGTRRMIRRPIRERVLSLLRPARLRRLREAVARAIRPR